LRIKEQETRLTLQEHDDDDNDDDDDIIEYISWIIKHYITPYVFLFMFVSLLRVSSFLFHPLPPFLPLSILSFHPFHLLHFLF